MWGGGDTDAWYQKVERISDLRIRILPLKVRFRFEREAALFLAFWRSEFQRVAVFSGLMGRRTPRVARGSVAAGG